jgi:hypothetical protein
MRAPRCAAPRRARSARHTEAPRGNGDNPWLSSLPVRLGGLSSPGTVTISPWQPYSTSVI